MKRNNITELYEALGPTEAEKERILGNVLKAGPKRRFNPLPLGLLAATLALFAIVSAPFWGPWLNPNGGGDTIVPGSQSEPPAASAEPAVSAPVSAPSPSPSASAFSGLAGDNYRPATGKTVLRQESALSLDGVETVEVSAVYQDVKLTLTDAAELTLRHYDFDDAKPMTLTPGGRVIKAESGQKSLNGTHKVTARFELEIPRSFRGAVKVGNMSGDITVTGDATWSHVSLSTMSGDVKAGSVEAEDVKLSSMSGDVTADKVTAGTYSVSSLSGDVTVGEASGRGKVSSISGRVKIGDEPGVYQGRVLFGADLWNNWAENWETDWLPDFEERMQDLEDWLEDRLEVFENWRFDWPDDMTVWMPELPDFTLREYTIPDIGEWFGVYVIGEVAATGDQWIEIDDERHGTVRVDISKAAIYPEGRQIRKGDCVFLRRRADGSAYGVNVARRK